MTTSTVSKPVEPQRPAQGHNASAKSLSEKPAEADLFANLLSLVSDTRTPPDAPPPQADANDAGREDPQTNPLAALLAWSTPGSGIETAAAAAADTEGAADTAGVDISGMTRVDEGADGLLLADEPASAPARPAFANAAARPAFTSPRAEASAQGTAPALVWQRGAASGTDALHQQHSAQMAQQAPVRSTVALGERFSLSGASASAASAVLREASIETATNTPQGAARPSLEATQTLVSAAAADTGTGEHAGDAPGETLPGEQPGRGEASAEADAPTVTHWGTQHLRHASLRVGEQGADAIDIQLSMKGQEVQVAFQSDNADARATLREGASEALAELLQRSGIQLGHVSVGAQGRQNGEGAAQHTPTVNRGERLARSDATPADAPATPARPLRADGSRPIDLFV